MTWCFVLGAAGGIGSAVTRLLESRGIKFVGVDRKRASQTLQIDLGSATRIKRSFNVVIRRWGVPSAVISCLGTYSRTGLERYTEKTFRNAMQDNFNCIFWAANVLMPKLASAGGGRFIVTTSQAGAAGGHDPVYASAKAACCALVKSVAREYGRAGVRCNGVSPGPVNTRAAHKAMGRGRIAYYNKAIPIGRVCEPAEVAALLVYLAVDAPDALNGAIYDVDGGLIRR